MAFGFCASIFDADISAQVPQGNILPNHDFIADKAGYALWYVDQAGQPMGQEKQVWKIEGEALVIDLSQVQPLKNGGLLMVEIPKEDVEHGKKYRLSVELQMEKEGMVMMELPGEVNAHDFLPDKGRQAYSGNLPAGQWRKVVKVFRFDEAHQDSKGKLQVVFFLQKVWRPMKLRRMYLVPMS